MRVKWISAHSVIVQRSIFSVFGIRERTIFRIFMLCIVRMHNHILCFFFIFITRYNRFISVKSLNAYIYKRSLTSMHSHKKPNIGQYRYKSVISGTLYIRVSRGNPCFFVTINNNYIAILDNRMPKIVKKYSK